MNLAVRTTVPLRVTSETSTTPRPVDTSTRRPAFVAAISNVCTPLPTSTAISTRSPRIHASYAGGETRAPSAGRRMLEASTPGIGGAQMTNDLPLVRREWLIAMAIVFVAMMSLIFVVVATTQLHH